MSLENLFNQMAKAAGSNSGSTFFTDGVYKVELKEIEYIANGYRGTSCKFHFTVLESNNPAHAPQATRSWIVKLDKTREQNERTMADIKNLVFALTGTSLKQVGSVEVNPKVHTQATEAFFSAIDATVAKKTGMSPTLLIGRQAALECMSVKTKEGGDFTRHVWGPVTPTTA